MGRPLLDLDEQKIADLASRGASNNDIAALMGCDDQTIINRFSTLLYKTRAARRMRIRDRQFEAMNNGNITMMIWLGKQELDQTDVVVSKVEAINSPVVIMPDNGTARQTEGTG